MYEGDFEDNGLDFDDEETPPEESSNRTFLIAAGILGGTVSATSHLVKAGSRVMINTSPEPFSNWAASLFEDFLVIGGLFTALHFPLLFLILFILFLVLAVWLIPRLWRAIRFLWHKLCSIFSSKDQSFVFDEQVKINRQTDANS